MKNLTRAALALALALAPLAACDAADAGEALSCPSDPGPFTLAQSRVTGTVALEALPDAPLSKGDTIVIRGTANHEDGLAIRQVVVAGVAATLNAFNFQRWTVTLSYQDLVLAGTPDAGGQVPVEAAAVDACGNRYPFEAFTLPVDLTPNIAITDLTVTATYPGERSSLPSNESAAAALTITATGRAGGAHVALHAASGKLQGVNAAGEVLLVAQPGTDVATATALFYADTPGAVVITATAEGALGSTVVTAAARPVFAPSRAVLVPSASLLALIVTDGVLDSCQASPTTGLAVRQDGSDIGTAAVAMERNELGRYQLEVAGLAGAKQADSVTVTCRDEYGQSGSGTFTLTVTNPPSDIVVDDVSLAIAVPQGRDHLPADGTATAVVTVAATGNPANARVILTASNGVLQGIGLDGGVTLGATGDGEAGATVLFTPNAAGTAVITAAYSTGATAITTVPVVAAPRLAPAGATLYAGTGLDVAVLTSGEIAGCQATPSASITVTTLDGGDVTAAPTAIGDGPGGQAVHVEAAPDAEDGASITLTCQDVWGQFASATFTATAP
ncbi:MAG: hypothetical protein CVU56_23000 [Deltaproteobacteria bacterium HGW-Deltaproteobacteria-14]|jgi:hypothetical protein|nr:MAG: hypothetical protein CVU56_23000 [Deltaproteobacteria bacterium HGW-Deltaproteobacteria-14]